MMAESTDFRNLNDLSQLRRLNQSSVGCVLFQRQVSPEIAIVEEVFFENPFQMPFSEHDHMIQTLSANGPVLLRSPLCGGDARAAHQLCVPQPRPQHNLMPPPLEFFFEARWI